MRWQLSSVSPARISDALVRDHALVTYMGEPYLAQSPDTGPSPDTIRYIVSGSSPDTIDTNLPCRVEGEGEGR